MLSIYNTVPFYLFILIFFLACNRQDEEATSIAKVYIEKNDTGYKLIRNGKPFFIKGAGGQGYLEKLKQAGANTIRVYDPENLSQILDRAEELDIAVIADIPLPTSKDIEFYSNSEKFGEIRLNVVQLVTKYKEHPALLYWNLGNELLYPSLSFKNEFSEKYNELIDLIHQLDPNHPVSTSIIGGNRRRLASIVMSSPQLDFLSFNTFGNSHELEDKIETLSLLWDGPYVISEWGINGPWEEIKTSWGAPIEPTSSEKAEQLLEKYQIIKDIDHKRLLGHIAFYWGQKQESTPTWFSIFSTNGKKCESFHTLSSIWTEEQNDYVGPPINEVKLNGMGAKEDIVLHAGSTAELEVQYQENSNIENYTTTWEIRKEAWFNPYENNKTVNSGKISHYTVTKIKIPETKGPYRIYITTYNGEEFATANIPFYVLNTREGNAE